jgi:hypothetical protein
MLEVLCAFFERSFPFSDKDKELIQSVMISKTLRKGAFLARQVIAAA